ncbi:DoxX family protein [uncultured Phycicoccus sp.]|uniref:DoxX family protein n=1 Tax=uncultured Phycicoccus sp. TaxID=661422 RepID=UPI0026102E8E|nr:DoxX family protein [uncultured Phycicoccus sp.]
MDIAVWIVSGLLALVFLAAAATKLTQSKEQLEGDPKMAWTQDFGEGTIRLVAGLEVLGALGLVLPRALDIAPVLAPLAATGLAAVMLGAIVTHVRRREQGALPMNIGLLVLAAFVATTGFAA